LGIPSGTPPSPSFLGGFREEPSDGNHSFEMSSSLVGSLPEETVGNLGTAMSSGVLSSPLVVTGKSGVRHSFTLGMRDAVSVVLACDVVVGNAPIDETKVLALFIKVYDVNARNVILCGVPSLTQEAQKLAAQYKMMVLEGSDREQVIEELADTLRKLPKEH